MEAAVEDAQEERRLRASKRREDVKRSVDGRDDMNLAEFPLASLDDRLPKDQKTLVFEDEIQGGAVTRRLTISAADNYGLPTALDDEVILGLIQLTRMKGFAEKRVEFTRYELVRLLGWREDGKSYQRIDESLKRWLGVSLFYDKAWWDQEEKSWVSESFHILDNVTLYDRERYARRKKAGGLAGGRSSFVWNEIVFRSFKSGYLKKLDLDIYRRFQSAVAKRLYRFLDKRFYLKPRWEFDLHTLCFDKLGMARTDHTGDLKRRLKTGIKELVEQRILRPMKDNERYRKDGIGRWTVILERYGKHNAQLPEATSGLIEQLVERGLSRRSAAEFANSRAEKMIVERIELHDWLVKRRDKRASRRPAGFLAQSIRHEYPLPEDYQAAVGRKRAVPPERIAQPVNQTEALKDQKLAADPERTRFRVYFNSLSDEEQLKFESEATSVASRVHAESYARLRDTKGSLFEQIRDEMLMSYLRSRGLFPPDENPQQAPGPARQAMQCRPKVP